MGTKIILNLNGKRKEVSIDNIRNELSVDLLYTGSISYEKDRERSSYYFNLVNSEELYYVLDEAKKHLDEVKIEVRSYDRNTEGVQQEDFRPNSL
tara:strand:- start:170 stop:454 length:285 start_codon:yes stop_codon:yes gene_type:complete